MHFIRALLESAHEPAVKYVLTFAHFTDRLICLYIFVGLLSFHCGPHLLKLAVCKIIVEHLPRFVHSSELQVFSIVNCECCCCHRYGFFIDILVSACTQLNFFA